MTGDGAPVKRRAGGRVRTGTVKPLPVSTVEKWLLESRLATRDDDGQLVLTAKGHRIGGSLDQLG